jgi:hypothetical protein
MCHAFQDSSINLGGSYYDSNNLNHVTLQLFTSIEDTRGYNTIHVDTSSNNKVPLNNIIKHIVPIHHTTLSRLRAVSVEHVI